MSTDAQLLEQLNVDAEMKRLLLDALAAVRAGKGYGELIELMRGFRDADRAETYRFIEAARLIAQGRDASLAQIESRAQRDFAALEEELDTEERIGRVQQAISKRLNTQL